MLVYTQMLHLNKQFKTLYYHGMYKAHPKIVTYGRKNHLPESTRIGITTGKKIGNAVLRNRARRIIKAAYMELEKEMPLQGWDFVFVARKDIHAAKSTEIKKIIQKQVGTILACGKKAGSTKTSSKKR